MFRIPPEAQANACESILDLNAGGTQTGLNRARQLCKERTIDLETMRNIKAWMARHGPGASNGGTSYAGYKRWREKCSDPVHFIGCPDLSSGKYPAPVSWLRWGGDAMYKFIQKVNI